MTICSVQGLTKSYGSQLIFEKLSFEINEGEKIGFTGRNGTGKTTIFKCLSGIEQPDEGTIAIKKGKRSAIWLKYLFFMTVRLWKMC